MSFLGRLGRFALVAALSALAACGGAQSSGEEQRRSREGGQILVVVKTLDNPFFVSIVEGIEAAAGDKYTVVVRAGNNESDVSTQRQILDQYYSSDVSGVGTSNLAAVILTPAGSGGQLVDSIKRFRDADIPVILIDTPIDEAALRSRSTNVNLFIGSNNLNGGELAGQLIKGLFPERPAKILLLNGAEQSDTAQQRRRGFLTSLRGANITVTERTANWRRTDARSVTASLLAIGERYDAVFAANDEMALGALRAFESSQGGAPPIIGFDAIDEARTAVEERELFATIAQDPYQMGVQAISLLPAAKEWQNEERLVRLRVVDGD